MRGADGATIVAKMTAWLSFFYRNEQFSGATHGRVGLCICRRLGKEPGK